ncbi:MAG: penicillin-binding protein, partial [Flavobacterium sp.]|nr:penicillin-binding protein [Flavobacterium sp.]
MKPLENESPKLTTDYIAEKQKKIDSFYNKTWPNNSMNGAFLVAKNGQILYEKYEGFANFRDKTPITNETPIHIASV